MVIPRQDDEILPNWFGWVVVISLLSIVVSIAFGCLYALYLYVEIDALRLSLFVFVVSVSASLWQLACSYNKYPPARQQQQQHQIITASPVQIRTSWSDLSTGSAYQISPDGIKGPSNGESPILEEQPKKRGRRSVKEKVVVVEEEECLLVKLTTAIIRIFYGKGNKRIALIQKSVVEYHGEEGERPAYSHASLAYRYEGDHNKLRYPYIIPPTVVESGDAVLASIQEYNEKPSFITVREDREFSTGHRIVKQMKIQRTVSVS